MLSSAANPLTFDSRVLLSFRLPFIGGTVAIAHSRVKSDQFRHYLGFADGMLVMASVIIVGSLVCAAAGATAFNRCHADSGDPARIAHCAKWLR